MIRCLWGPGPSQGRYGLSFDTVPLRAGYVPMSGYAPISGARAQSWNIHKGLTPPRPTWLWGCRAPKSQRRDPDETPNFKSRRACLTLFSFLLFALERSKNKKPKKAGTLSREIGVPTGTAHSADPLRTNGPMLIKL